MTWLQSILVPKCRHDYLSAEAQRTRSDRGIDSISQLHQLNQVWKDATSDIPYYRDLVATGDAPPTLRSWLDVARIPVLSRQIIQENPEDFVRDSGPPDSVVRTAGSTGRPLRIGMNSIEKDLMRILKVSEWQRFGYKLDSRLFLIWGHSHLLGTGVKGSVNHLIRKAKDRLLNYQRVDAYRLNRNDCKMYAEALLRFRPLGIIGYASALDLFAQYTREYRDQFRSAGIRFVLATSEPAPRPDSLPMISDLFGCPVVQEYGGAEFGQVAFKVSNEPFKVYSHLNYVECESHDQDDVKFGESNERKLSEFEAIEKSILLTSLYPRYMPLIRYRVSDAIRDPIVWTNGHVAEFAQVSGRLNDMFTLADGNSIHSVAILHCIHPEPSVRNIQMIVRELGIEINLISTSPGDQAVVARIQRRLACVHSELRNAKISFVEDLVTNHAGKRRWFVDERESTARANV